MYLRVLSSGLHTRTVRITSKRVSLVSTSVYLSTRTVHGPLTRQQVFPHLVYANSLSLGNLAHRRSFLMHFFKQILHLLIVQISSPCSLQQQGEVVNIHHRFCSTLIAMSVQFFSARMIKIETLGPETNSRRSALSLNPDHNIPFHVRECSLHRISEREYKRPEHYRVAYGPLSLRKPPSHLLFSQSVSWRTSN
jgi:hypothetical protein